MRARFSLIVIFLLSLPGALSLFAETAIYRSNDFGMQLKPLPSWRRDEKWILEVIPGASGEVRRLLSNGKEVRRWVITRSAGSAREEREFDDGALAARRVYDQAGNLLEEDQYAKGKLTQKSFSTYESSRLARVRVVAADGTVAYSEGYLYTSRGSLREVRRTGGKDGPLVSTFDGGRSGLSEERNLIGSGIFVARYDAHGRVIERERRIGDKLDELQDFVYRGDADTLESSVEKHPGENRTIARAYDSQGRLQSETVTKGASVVEEDGYVRDEKGRVIRETRRTSAGLEEHRYVRDPDGKIAREELYRRGSLEKVTLYGTGELRTEELYQGGVLFLKAFFDGDRRLREEVYVDGKLVRERKIE